MPAANDVLVALRRFERAKDSHSSAPVTVVAGELLVESRVRLPGIDGLSVDYDEPAQSPESREASVLPLGFSSCDGSPLRGIARVRTR
jgi:kynurenine formamidase